MYLRDHALPVKRFRVYFDPVTNFHPSPRPENLRRGVGSPMTRDVWERILAEYRLTPGKHERVGRAAGVSTMTARRYWFEGRQSPATPWAHTPIQTILEAESLELRAELQLDREAAERGLATHLGQLDHLRSRADRTAEAVTNVQLARVLKAQVIDAAGTVAHVLESLTGDHGEVLRMIFDGEKFKDLCADHPDKALRQIRTVVKIVKELTEVADMVVKLERLLLGESTENKAVHVQHTFESSADAIETINRAAAAARRAQGVIDVPALERAAETATQ
jgi:hypothetical protein